MDILQRKLDYSGEHCWQYDIRLRNRDRDLELAHSHGVLSPESLRVADFSLQYEEKSACYRESVEFIERHEWLGRMSLHPTHIFTARLQGLLCGVVVMDMPNAFSKLLGEGTRKIERLISRGACISFSPKNLGSALIMHAVRWMVQNTRFRLFTAYSDPEARELGTIYQACNFYYLGRTSGTNFQYKLSNGRWVSDRYFRSRSVYKKLAKMAGVQWVPEWQQGETSCLIRCLKKSSN